MGLLAEFWFKKKDRLILQPRSKSFVLKVYSSAVFCRIRHHFGVTDDEFVRYLGPEKGKLSGGPSQGKSK